MNSAHSIDFDKIAFLVDLQACGQRDSSMFSKRPREHGAGASPLFCAGHLGELLEDGGSGRRAKVASLKGELRAR